MEFTDRSKLILKNAEAIARQTTGLVYPAHILLAMLEEKTGVCAELNMSYPQLKETLYARMEVVYKAELGASIEVEQIQAWKDACINANGGIAKEAAKLNRELKDSEKERRKLEKELTRKEKALAEAAALLVLSKKADAIWGDPEEEQ